MTKKLFVGGLSWDTQDEQLKAAFEKFGAVAEAKVILDNETGRSRGFGFVSFGDDSAATTAIQEMDGKELDGRVIRVNEAQEKPRGPRRDGPPPRRDGAPARSFAGGGGGGGGGQGRPAFRSDDRPPARGGGGGGNKRRGGRGESKPDDRFGRRRNAQTKRGRPSFDEHGGGGYEEDI